MLFIFILAISLIAGPIEEMSPNEWYEVPNSRMDALDPKNDPNANPNYPNTPPWRGVNGISSAIGAWSSGAFDTQRDRLIVWGGGHNDYAGNEIYVFDLNTLQWERVTDPAVTPPPLWTTDGLESTGYYAQVGNPSEPDLQQPRSRHTYEYIEYVPYLDALCSFGSACQYPYGSYNYTDCYDFTNGQWDRKTNSPIYGVGGFSALDPVTGHVWVHGSSDNLTSRLYEYDPANDIFYTRSGTNYDMKNLWGVVGDIDPVRRKFVAIGQGRSYEWDISNPSNVTHGPLTTTGDNEIISEVAPGLAYDPVNDRMIAWSGGQDVYMLDLDNNILVKQTGTGANPGPQNHNGTYGRFRYVPSKNVFVVVSNTSENVFIYKLSGDIPDPDPDPPIIDTIYVTVPVVIKDSVGTLAIQDIYDELNIQVGEVELINDTLFMEIAE